MRRATHVNPGAGGIILPVRKSLSTIVGCKEKKVVKKSFNKKKFESTTKLRRKRKVVPPFLGDGPRTRTKKYESTGRTCEKGGGEKKKEAKVPMKERKGRLGRGVWRGKRFILGGRV